MYRSFSSSFSGKLVCRGNTTLKFFYGMVGRVYENECSPRYILHMQMPSEPLAVSFKNEVFTFWYAGNKWLVVFPGQFYGITNLLVIQVQCAINALLAIIAHELKLHGYAVTVMEPV